MNTRTVLIAGAAVAALVALYAAKRGVQAIGNGLNPVNPDNWVNQAATSVYRDLSGSVGTIGGDIYDWTHPPGTENTNVINGAATSIYRKITGSTGTIGGDLYDWLH